MLKDLQHFLTEPKILGKILEWGLIWGTLIGTLCLLVAMFILKERKAMIFSLLLLAASALLVWPADSFRNRQRTVDLDHAVAAQKLNSIRQQNAWIFYAQGALASLAVLSLGSNDKAGKIFMGAAIVGAIVVVGFALWLQVSELQIFMPSLRSRS